MRQQFLRLAGLLTAAAGEIAFEKVVLSSTNDYAHTVRAADLDGDGDLDAVFAAKHAQVVGWVNNADGIFEQFYEVQIDRRGGLSSVACGDVDGDGTIDVVAAAQAGNALYVYFNNGGGGFTISTISDAAKAPSALELTDVDGDGDLDVVVASFGGELDWYENSGNKFASTPSHAIATGLQLTKAVGVGDVGGGARIEFIFATPIHPMFDQRGFRRTGRRGRQDRRRRVRSGARGPVVVEESRRDRRVDRLRRAQGKPSGVLAARGLVVSVHGETL